MAAFQEVVVAKRKIGSGITVQALLVACCIALSGVCPEGAEAQVRYASDKRSNTAIAHYARARAMCVETLEEFEVGRKHARPDLLLDPEEWRLTMISLCEQLNRLVDPKIRISNAGVQVSANPRMIHRAKDRLPEVVDGPKIRNDHGEMQRLKEKQEARAKLYSPQPTATATPQSTTQAQETIGQSEAKQVSPSPQANEPQLSEEELIEQAIEEAVNARAEESRPEVSQTESEDVTGTEEIQYADEEPVPSEDETTRDEIAIELQEQAAEQSTQPSDAREIPSEEQDVSAEAKSPANGDDAKIASAIEQAIQDKMREIEGATGARAPSAPENTNLADTDEE